MAVGFLDFSKKHAVAESTALLATHWGDHIYNIRMSAAHDNGVIVAVGDYEGDDIYKEAAIAANSFEGVILEQAANGSYVVKVNKSADGVALVLSVPETYYDFESAASDEAQFYNEKDDVARAYQLRYGDRFTLSAEGFTTTPTTASIGKKVTVDASSKKLVIAS